MGFYQASKRKKLLKNFTFETISRLLTSRFVCLTYPIHPRFQQKKIVQCVSTKSWFWEAVVLENQLSLCNLYKEYLSKSMILQLKTHIENKLKLMANNVC